MIWQLLKFLSIISASNTITMDMVLSASTATAGTGSGDFTLEALVLAAQKGDEAAFGEVYDLLSQRLWRYVSFRVDSEDVEDLTSEIWLKIVQNLKKYRSQKGASFSSWAFRIAHNIVIDFYRKKKDILGIETDENEFFSKIPDTERTPDELVLKQGEYEALHAALLKVKPDHREILQLKFLEGFSNREIAAITKKSEGNIRVLQLRALREIRQHLSA